MTFPIETDRLRIRRFIQDDIADIQAFTSHPSVTREVPNIPYDNPAKLAEYIKEQNGLELFAACDGKRSVQAIVRRFAKGHKMSRAEAELSVTTFLKALLAKGMVVMEMDLPSRSKRK